MDDQADGAGRDAHPTVAEWLAVTGVRKAVASPDGEFVACYERRETDAGLAIRRADGGERTLFVGEGTVGSVTAHLAWRADGTAVLYHRSDGSGGTDVGAVDRDGTVRSVLSRAGDILLTDVADGQMLYLHAANGARDLRRYDLASDADVPLTDGAFVSGAKFGPRGELVAYAASDESAPTRPTVHVVDRDGTDRTALSLSGPDGAPRYGAVRDWSTDDRLLLQSAPAIRSDLTLGVGTLDRAALDGDRATLAPEWFGSDDRVEHPLAFLDGERVLAERETRAATLVPALYGPDGDAVEVSVPPGLADFAGEGYGARLAGGGVLVESETPARPPELRRYRPGAAGTERLVSPTAQGVDLDSCTDARHATIRSADGTEVGLICYDPPRGPSPAPAVVRVSDRPMRRTLRRFRPSDQLLLDRGIGVLRVNQRGANGYLGGPESDLSGEFGAGDRADVAAAAAWLADRDWVDGDRVGVVGRHYGGYAALVQAFTRPSRYACVVAWGAITDLEAFRADGNADPRIRAAVERWLAPLDDRTRAERSPITRVESLSAPLGLLHRTTDPKVPASQTERLCAELDARGFEAGTDYERRWLDGDDRSARTAGYEFVVDFLDRHL